MTFKKNIAIAALGLAISVGGIGGIASASAAPMRHETVRVDHRIARTDMRLERLRIERLRALRREEMRRHARFERHEAYRLHHHI